MHFLPLLSQLEGVLRVSVPSLGTVCASPLSRHSPAPSDTALVSHLGCLEGMCAGTRVPVCVWGRWDGDKASTGTVGGEH